MNSKNKTINPLLADRIKQEAKAILQEVGVPHSVAIDIFYRQVVLKRGLPFEVCLPKRPIVREELSKKEFDEILMQGLMELDLGATVTIREAFEKLERGL